jgi:hypothetical protein
MMSRVFKTMLRKRLLPNHMRAALAAMPLAACVLLGGSYTGAAEDAYRPPSDTYSGQSGVNSYNSYRPAPPPSGAYQSPGGSYDSYQPPQGGGAEGDSYQPPSQGYGSNTYQPSQPAPNDGYGAYNGQRDGGATGYGEPYHAPQANAGPDERYDQGPPPEDRGPRRGSYSQDEIIGAGNRFFGKVSGGLASAIEWAFQKAGRPNGYILGQDAGGAFVAGLAYGEGTLYTKDVGSFKVYWQGPSVGYDFGADGSKVMTLVYNLRDPSEIFDRFGGVAGAAYLVGGVSVQLQKAGHVTLAPIHAGVGLRLGANVGYMKYTRNPTWNPF